MPGTAPLKEAVLVLLLVASCSDTSKCLDDEDMPACSRACVGEDSGEACAKRLELATAVCEGKRTHPRWKTPKEACDAQRDYTSWALRKR